MDLDPALIAECEMKQGSFLDIALGGTWDVEAFLRFARLVRAACISLEGADQLPRPIVEAIYFLDSQFDRSIPPNTMFPPGVRVLVQEHVALLAAWLFSGVCPFEDPSSLERELLIIANASPPAP